MSHTNRASGIGAIAHGLFSALPCDSLLSIRGRKGCNTWSSRQDRITRPTPVNLTQFIRHYQPDVLLSIETTFDNGHMVHDVCAEHHVKTATIIMHEAYSPGLTRSGLYICPTRVCFDRVAEPNKAYFELPIELDLFPFTPRTRARRLLHVMGFGTLHNRRQTREVVAGFLVADIPNATLTVHCLQEWRHVYGHHQDPRVTYRRQFLPQQRTIYDDFDILLQPDAYAGFGLPLLEAQACGLPVITTDAPPMNEQITNHLQLVPVDHTQRLESRGTMPTRVNTDLHIVTPDTIADTIRRVAAANITLLSFRARRYAETRAWTETKAHKLRALIQNIPG